MKKALQSAIMLLLAFAVSASASAAPCAAGQPFLFGGKEREHAGEFPAGPGAREKALEAEKNNADRLRDQNQLKDKNRHKRP